MLIVLIDIPRVIRNGLHPSRTHSTRPDLSGLAQGGRNGIWDVMRTNINNVRLHEENFKWVAPVEKLFT